MGGCITPPVPKKAKPPTKPQARQSTNKMTENAIIAEPAPPPSIAKPKYKKIIGEQFIKLNRIEQNVGTTSRMQGPKYVSSYSDGTGKVLRIIPSHLRGMGSKDSEVETRAQAYAEILGLEIYEDDESNLLVFQEYCCGPYLYELSDPASQPSQDLFRSFLLQVYTLIEQFHAKSIILGNIGITSFRQVSEYCDKVTLVQLNLLAAFHSEDSMGHAFKLKPEKSMDWEAFGFLVQSVSGAGLRCPIFVQHKLEYIDGGGTGAVAALLKGKKIKREEIDTGKYSSPNQSIILGYQFRADLIRLLKIRKRRSPHRQIYYVENTDQSGKPSLNSTEESFHRLQTSRILSRIESYIENVKPQCEEAFLMYSPANESLNKLKGVFVMTDQAKKMQEFRETLTLIK